MIGAHVFLSKQCILENIAPISPLKKCWDFWFSGMFGFKRGKGDLGVSIHVCFLGVQSLNRSSSYGLTY